MLLYLGIFLTLVFFTVPIRSSAPLPFSDMISRQESYIASLQSEAGYLTMNTASTKINPYFNNIALWAIADNEDYFDLIKNWLLWYSGNINVPDKLGVHGTIYDYTVAAHKKITTDGRYDSSDSYAATFLTLVRHCFDAGFDREFILPLEKKLDLIASAIYSTRDPGDGLTYAKKDYEIKYFMDNLEVRKGLEDWGYLLEHLFLRPDDAKKAYADSKQISDSLEQFWNKTSFAYAKDNQGKFFYSDTTIFYPDMTAQLMAIVYDFVNQQRAQLIWRDFNRNFPNWTKLQHQSSYPWALMSYTAYKIGDKDKAREYLNSVHISYGSMEYPWPWYILEAGWYLQTLKSFSSGE